MLVLRPDTCLAEHWQLFTQAHKVNCHISFIISRYFDLPLLTIDTVLSFSQ